MGEVILTMKDIDKSFPGVHALDHVNFEVKRGEVHALMGENGAGKSTLMKVLTGIYQKDSGSITYKGKETEFHNTREAQDAGVVIVHQELNMVGDLTVAQNIFIGREPKKGFSIDDKKMIEDSKKLFQELNIEINPKEKKFLTRKGISKRYFFNLLHSFIYTRQEYKMKNQIRKG